jgi:hypothetical protein
MSALYFIDIVPETILQTEPCFSLLMTHDMKETSNRLWFDIDEENAASDVRLPFFLCPTIFDLESGNNCLKKFPAKNVCLYCFYHTVLVLLFCRELFSQLFLVSS